MFRFPFVSVIISTYNTAGYLRECLDSVFSQTLNPIEIIVVDDGSTDETPSILMEYQKTYDNLYVITQDNTGQGIARNRAMEIAQGEYLAYMDPDDRYPRRDCLEKLFLTAKEKKALLVGGNILFFGEGKSGIVYTSGDGNVKHDSNCFVRSQDYYKLMGHTRFLYSSEMMRRNMICFAPYRRFEDQILTIGALAEAQRFYELDYPVYDYRIGHKKTEYSAEIYLDILKGIRDTFTLLYQRDLELMYKRNYQDTIFGAMRWIKMYRDTNNEEWDSVIDDIQTMAKIAGWTKDEDLIRSVMDRCDKERERFELLLQTDRPIIVYGAGKNTEYILQQYNFYGRIIGIAVTEFDNANRMIGGIQIRKLDWYESYKDDALLLITPSEKYRRAMEKMAFQKEFSSVMWIDTRLL